MKFFNGINMYIYKVTVPDNPEIELVIVAEHINQAIKLADEVLNAIGITIFDAEVIDKCKSGIITTKGIVQ